MIDLSRALAVACASALVVSALAVALVRLTLILILPSLNLRLHRAMLVDRGVLVGVGLFLLGLGIGVDRWITLAHQRPPICKIESVMGNWRARSGQGSGRRLTPRIALGYNSGTLVADCGS